VAAQVAVTLVLLAGATLFAKSLVAALRLNPGFDTTRIVSGSVSLFGHGYELEGADRFFTDLRNRLDREPAIRSASMGVSLGGMTTSGTVRIDGERRQLPSFLPYMAVDDRYFATIGMPILRGRNFTQDDTATAPLVVLVSESFGRLLANGGDPIGTRITESSSRMGQPPAVATVVGVVPDVVTNVAVLEPLALYYALPQKAAGQSRTIVVRAAGDATAASAAAMAAIRAGDGRLAPAPFLTMEDRISRQMGPQSFGALVLGVLGAIAVLLTLLGTYVLAESMASMRRREVGIRAALGATRGSLSQLLLFETVRLVGFGIAAGLAMAWLGAETVRAFLYQVQPLDVTTLAGVSALILTLALAVSLRPVARASRVNLASVLREE
jgi:predicted lysophospholipase L1 biosynthesis ABC-type transport system permease subunit